MSNKKAKEIAEKIGVIQYSDNFDKEIIDCAEESNVVIARWHSDDIVSLYGRIRDEVGSYGGGHCFIHRNGILSAWDDGDEKPKDEAMQYFDAEPVSLRMDFDDATDDRPYSIMVDDTSVEQYEFTIFDDDEHYCNGTVFSLDYFPFREKDGRIVKWGFPIDENGNKCKSNGDSHNPLINDDPDTDSFD